MPKKQTSDLSSPHFFASAYEFRTWLEANAAKSSELFVGFWKVDSGKPCMTWSESVDEALCFGWIDGVRKRIDGMSYQIRFTPRKPTSIWSAVNILKFEKLQAEGRMTESGFRAYAHRQDSKSKVYAYEQAFESELAKEELIRFKKCKTAWAYFQACPPSYRKVVLHWVTSAKRIETRVSRLQKLIDACAYEKRLR